MARKHRQLYAEQLQRRLHEKRQTKAEQEQQQRLEPLWERTHRRRDFGAPQEQLSNEILQQLMPQFISLNRLGL